MKKKFLSLILCFAIVFSLAVPVTAYENEQEFIDDESVITFSLDEMTEVEDGVYSIDVPLVTQVFNQGGTRLYQTYADCSYQFTTHLNAKYYTSSHSLQVGVTVQRNSGLGLIKNIKGRLGYTQYKNDGSLVQTSNADKSLEAMVPTYKITISEEFKWIYLNPGTEYISLSASGSFTLIDGFGSFSGSNRAVDIIY